MGLRLRFPLAHALNSFSTTAMMVVLSMLGRSELAIEVAIVQAATLVTFQALSGDARSLILRVEANVSAAWILRARLLLAAPLSIAAWSLGAGLSSILPGLAATLILRRIAEWIAEVDLADAEFLGDSRTADRSLFLQTLANAILILSLGHGPSAAQAAALAWAIAPAAGSIRFVWNALRRPAVAKTHSVVELLPHLGSTTIIAVSVFAFRCLIVALAGKRLAGDLVSAYSIGGMIVSLFGMAVGPSLAFQRDQRQLQSGDTSGVARWLPLHLPAVGVALLAASGAALAGIPAVTQFAVAAMGKSAEFCIAVGASLTGGAIMLVAWSYRFRLLQRQDLFGADVLANLSILLSVPMAFRLLGARGLQFSYLVNALICLAFYMIPWLQQRFAARFAVASRSVPTVCAAGLMVPVFVQLGSGLFVDPTPFFDAAGRLSATPLPLSIVFCYVGLLLMGDLKPARMGLACIFFTSVLIMLTTLVSSRGDSALISAKTLLGLQFLLPMPAFVLGQMAAGAGLSSGRLSRIALLVVGVLIPLQLAAMWRSGGWHLVPNVFLFSIYQQIQYVPVVMVSLYFVALFGLKDVPRWGAMARAFAPVVGLYAAAAKSYVSILAFVLGMGLYAGIALRQQRRPSQIVGLTLVSFAAAATFLVVSAVCDADIREKYGFAENGGMPKSVSQRLPCWGYYAERILKEPESWLAGHPQAPPRNLYPSAHNFVLDFVFNLGALPILPLALLFGSLLRRVVQCRHDIGREPPLLGLCVAVALVVGIDNALKVGLRQPYPGIVGYFLSGMLLSQLQRVTMVRKKAISELEEALESIPEFAAPSIDQRSVAPTLEPDVATAALSEESVAAGRRAA